MIFFIRWLGIAIVGLIWCSKWYNYEGLEWVFPRQSIASVRVCMLGAVSIKNPIYQSFVWVGWNHLVSNLCTFYSLVKT